jgi:hypothetical protein
MLLRLWSFKVDDMSSSMHAGDACVRAREKMVHSQITVMRHMLRALPPQIALTGFFGGKPAKVRALPVQIALTATKFRKVHNIESLAGSDSIDSNKVWKVCARLMLGAKTPSFFAWRMQRLPPTPFSLWQQRKDAPLHAACTTWNMMHMGSTTWPCVTL